jgi:soluble lytic murein transglycosylase-like protein
MTPAQLLLVAQAAKDHRHYGRAVELLRAARAKAPQRSDELTFEIGRAWFGAENFAEAEKTYLAGANATKDLKQKSAFLWHAARAVQLRGDDRRAEELMTAAVAVKGKFPSTSAALSQRLRTRLMQKRWAEAASDLQQIVRLFPQEHVRVETAVASAIANLAAGRLSQADRDLDAIPASLTDDYDESEIEYWKGRVAEARHDDAAVDHYLTVLRSSKPTHFAYFARARVQQPSFRSLLERELAERRTVVQKARGENAWDRARKAQTDVVLLHPVQAELETLRALYREVPAYRRVLELKPAAMPAFGDAAVANDAGARLLAMGLFDDALAEIERRFPIGKAESTLTQSLALNRAGASRDSILLVEIAMKSVPPDYLPELLPRTMLALLYPRYFFDIIQSDAERYDADPVLVLSIMREESRFNPRAKSVAAARGLLQFIITTARDVGRSLGIVDLDAQDLYDPRVIIQLGAKYIGDLLEQFGGNPYRAAAAYNAGPVQTRLWNRITPSAEDDFFLSTVNFDETKHYVRKVMNSYRRYGSLYVTAAPSGGLRPEP